MASMGSSYSSASRCGSGTTTPGSSTMAPRRDLQTSNRRSKDKKRAKQQVTVTTPYVSIPSDVSSINTGHSKTQNAPPSKKAPRSLGSTNIRNRRGKDSMEFERNHENDVSFKMPGRIGRIKKGFFKKQPQREVTQGQEQVAKPSNAVINKTGKHGTTTSGRDPANTRRDIKSGLRQMSSQGTSSTKMLQEVHSQACTEVLSEKPSWKHSGSKSCEEDSLEGAFFEELTGEDIEIPDSIQIETNANLHLFPPKHVNDNGEQGSLESTAKASKTSLKFPHEDNKEQHQKKRRASPVPSNHQKPETSTMGVCSHIAGPAKDLSDYSYDSSEECYSSDDASKTKNAFCCLKGTDVRSERRGDERDDQEADTRSSRKPKLADEQEGRANALPSFHQKPFPYESFPITQQHNGVALPFAYPPTVSRASAYPMMHPMDQHLPPGMYRPAPQRMIPNSLGSTISLSHYGIGAPTPRMDSQGHYQGRHFFQTQESFANGQRESANYDHSRLAGGFYNPYAANNFSHYPSERGSRNGTTSRNDGYTAEVSTEIATGHYEGGSGAVASNPNRFSRESKISQRTSAQGQRFMESTCSGARWVSHDQPERTTRRNIPYSGNGAQKQETQPAPQSRPAESSRRTCPRVFMARGVKVTMIDEENKIFVIDLFSDKTCELIRHLLNDHLHRVEASGDSSRLWRTLYTYTKMDLPCSEVTSITEIVQFMMGNINKIVGDVYGKQREAAKLRPRSWKEPHILLYQRVPGKPIHTGVEMHYDGCHMTWQLMLSGINEYEGGGTYIRCLKKTVKLRMGQVLVHPGELYHKGVDITSGTRLLMVGFMDGFDPKIKDNSKQKANEVEECEKRIIIV